MRLGSLVDFSSNQSIPASQIISDAWILDLEDIQKDSGKIVCKKRKHQIEIKSDKHIFKEGNVLYSKLRPYLNKVIVADEDGYSTSEILAFDFGEIVNRYAQLYLMSPFFVEYAMSYAYGVKMPRLSSKQGNEALMPIPPIGEQKRIVAQFDILSPYIAKYSENESLLVLHNDCIKTNLKKSILQEAMRGRLVQQCSEDEPASALLQRIKTEKERLIKEKKIKRDKSESVIFRGDDNCYFEKLSDGTIRSFESPFDIPDSWEWVRCESIFDIWSARRVHERDWRSSGVPFYRAREIGQLADKGHVANELYIDNSLYSEFSKSGVPQRGDLLVTAVGTLGKVFVVPDDNIFYFKDGSVICLSNFGKLNPTYLKYALMSDFFISQYANESQGTTVATLTMVRVKRYLLPIPPLAEQERIVQRINGLYKFL